MLEKFLITFIASCILISTTIYIWEKLNYKNIKNIFKNNFLKISFVIIMITINYMLINNFIKTVIATIILMFFYYLLYREKVKKCIITPLYSQFIVMISELIYIGIILIISSVNAADLTKIFFGSLLTNILIAAITFVIVQFKFIKKLYDFILKITDRIKEIQLIIISIILMVIANILTAFVYYQVSLIYLLVINTIIILTYTVFMFLYLKANNKYIKVYDKYNNTLNSLKEYEDILSRYRISNHENKNQLLTIRGMIKNKKVASYIDEIVENKIKDDEKLMFESLIIPEGGLRGLIYSKLLLMKENNIDYELSIAKNVKTTDLSKMDDDLVLNICNIVGVYLDNAIEEVKKLEEKYIVIEMYKDDTLNIAITNNYDGNIDIDNIDNVGYSTKGKNHGYGLSLVKQILNNNKKIKNIRRISEDEFTQELRIRYK